MIILSSLKRIVTEYDEFAVRRLCAAIVEQAIFDHRTALTSGFIDENTNPTRELRANEAEMISSLYWYFHRGGLEMNLEAAGFDIPAIAIRRKIRERFTRREVVQA